MSTESRQSHEISQIERATELVAEGKELIRELRARTREFKHSRRLTKSLVRSFAGAKSCAEEGKDLAGFV